MTAEGHHESELFDEWPDQYDRWFTTPIGRLVKHYETQLLLELLDPRAQERILDVGCGTGVFTVDVLSAGARLVGMDISHPMLRGALAKAQEPRFHGVLGDMRRLPFATASFDKVFSMTALEFVGEPHAAIAELDRVVRPGGTVVVTTLNSLGPWAERRRKKAARGHTLFQQMTFRSPEELAQLVPHAFAVKTAIHFQKDDDPEQAVLLEERGQAEQARTGAFVACGWRKEQGIGNTRQRARLGRFGP